MAPELCPRNQNQLVTLYLNEEGHVDWVLLALVIHIMAQHHVGQHHHLDEEGGGDDGDGSSHGHQGEEVEEEVLSVEGTNAVVDPHAVVVKAMHTAVAHTYTEAESCQGFCVLHPSLDYSNTGTQVTSEA